MTTDLTLGLGTRGAGHAENSVRLAPVFTSIRRTIAVVVTIAVAAAAWWWMAPPPLGGQTTVVAVDGTSMLPGLTQNDVVIIRPAAKYQVGDVVAYQRDAAPHRAASDRRHRRRPFHLKGDNNSFVDPEKPNRTALVGKKWITAPGLARVVSVLRLPIVLALFAAGAVLYQGVIGGAGGAASTTAPAGD